jgi:anti-sigma-K factor RskA
MKQLAQENQYQLWAIIDGKPVDAGVFDGNLAGLVKMKEIPSGAKTFAVTIEPRGGNASPTLEKMQVVGNVVKAKSANQFLSFIAYFLTSHRGR